MLKNDAVKTEDARAKYLEKKLDKETDMIKRSEILVEMRELYEVNHLSRFKEFFLIYFKKISIYILRFRVKSQLFQHLIKLLIRPLAAQILILERF